MAIPQPGFVGSSPADIVQGAQAQGGRWGELVAQGIQSGLAAYQKGKELRLQKDIQDKANQNAMDQLRYSLLAKDVAAKFEAAGPGAEGKVLFDNRDEVNELLTFFAGGDKEKANAMLQGIAQKISPATLNAMGVFGIQPEGQEAKATPAAQPAVPMARNAPGYVAPVTPSQLTTAGGAVPQAQTPAQPAAQPVAPVAPAVKPVAPSAAPTAQSSAASASAKTSIGEFTSKATSGIPKAVLDAAQPAIQSIQSLILDGINSDVDPKSKAAYEQAVRYSVRVLDNDTTKKLLKTGMKPEDLKARAQQYQDFINSDPDAAAKIKAMGVFTPKELQEYNALATQDRLLDKAIADATNSQDRNEIARQKLALDATLGPLKLQAAYDRISAARSRTTSDAERAALSASMDALKLTQQYVSAYSTAANAVFTAKKKDNASPEEKAQIIKEELKNKQGALYLNLMGAAQMYAKANGYTDVNKAMVELQAQHLIDLFGFQAVETRPGETFTAPDVFNAEGQKPAAPAAKKPTTAKPAPTAPSGSFDPNKYLPK
jgi:hypothetical protein